MNEKTKDVLELTVANGGAVGLILAISISLVKLVKKKK